MMYNLPIRYFLLRHCAYNCIADDTVADVADPMHMYYVNDGVYGSFNCILYDHVTVEASLLDVSIVIVHFS